MRMISHDGNRPDVVVLVGVLLVGDHRSSVDMNVNARSKTGGSFRAFNSMFVLR